MADGHLLNKKASHSTRLSHSMVRMRGLEPPRCHHHRLLRPARLPVPPHPRTDFHSTNAFVGCQATTFSRSGFVDRHDVRAGCESRPNQFPLAGVARQWSRPYQRCDWSGDVSTEDTKPDCPDWCRVGGDCVNGIDVRLSWHWKYDGVDSRIDGWSAAVPTTIASVVAVYELGALLIHIRCHAFAVAASLCIRNYR